MDFRTTDTQVNLTRSPYAVNMIAGENVFYPQKRTGYKKVTNFYFGGTNNINSVDNLKCNLEDTFHDNVSQNDQGSAHDTTLARANGIHLFKHKGKKFILCHFSNNLFLYTIGDDMPPILIYNALNDHNSSSFVMNSKLYLLDGKDYYCYDGTVFKPVCDTAFIPTTSITRSPSGGGTAFEDINLISSGRKNSFAADGSSRTFTLDAKELDSTPVTAVVNNAAMVEGTNFTVDRTTGVVTFNTVPPKFVGPDNVVITFYKTVLDNLKKIQSCCICGIYGGDNDTRVFFSGNPDTPNMDFASGLYDPTYFPDRGYTKIGSDNSAIVGYVKQFGNQLIIKDNNSQDASVYVRNFEIDANGKALFPVRQGISGVGCTAPHSIATVEDVPMFLTSDGVYAVTSVSSVQLERSLQNRSAFVDSKLLLEPNLSQAVSTVFEGKYYLCVNGNCYIADSRQKSYDRSSDSTQYEWYFWNNIPARHFLRDDNNLYFITDSGFLMRFYRNDENGIYNDDGQVINAVWRTPLMNLGSFHTLKDLSKISIILQPFLKSSCTLNVSTNHSPSKFLSSTTLDIFDWNDIDFNRFTFNTFISPKIWCVKSLYKKLNLISLDLTNAGKNEGFGIYSITLHAARCGS